MQFKIARAHVFHDPWVGTDTPGPGEAVFAIIFIGNKCFLTKNWCFKYVCIYIYIYIYIYFKKTV